jgi:hypothetical protein
VLRPWRMVRVFDLALFTIVLFHYDGEVDSWRQGLTLAYFSAQPWPFLPIISTEATHVSLKRCLR